MKKTETRKPVKKSAAHLDGASIHRRVATRNRGTDARDEEEVHLEEEEAAPHGAESGEGFGEVSMGRSLRMALAFNSLEVTVGIRLPVKGLTVDQAPSVYGALKEMLDEELSGMLPDIGATLVKLGEFRDEQEAEYRLQKSLRKKG